MKLNNEIIKQLAKEIGFDLIGFAKAEIINDELNLYKSWIKNGFHAGMDYMTKNIDKKKDVSKILPNVKSIISLGINYYNNETYHNIPQNSGKVSRYAWGLDYHIIVKRMLKNLESKLNQIDKDFISVSYTDTGPIMDKVWAVKAGLGWMGKHTNVINKVFGSWFFIANILCNYEFEYSKPINDFCGDCTACIDHCPTNAIVAPYVVDSNKCISYQTIENKKDIPEDFKGKFEGWAFGCDICQDVCPWNKKFSIVSDKMYFNPINKYLSLEEFNNMNEEEFRIKFKDSPIKRSKLNGIKRNLRYLFE